MVTIKCVPDKTFWGDKVPTTWEYVFEEAQMSVDEAAAEMRNIMLIMGYQPCQIAETFHPELVKDWGYDAKDSVE